MSGLPGYDNYKLASPYDGEPDHCLECGVTEENFGPDGECGCEPKFYSCDNCDKRVPEEQIVHILESYAGETYQCRTCVGTP